MDDRDGAIRAACEREAAASARSLAAAERAVSEGRLNVAKVLRAHALGARQRSLILARLCDEGLPATAAVLAALDDTVATEATLRSVPGPLADMALRSAQSAAAVLRVTADAVSSARDVSESLVAQLLWTCEVCGLLVEHARPEVCPSCGCIGGEFALFAPFFSGSTEHLARKQPNEILAQLRGDAGRMAGALAADDTALRRAEAGEWCAKEIAGHMLDISDLARRRLDAAISGAVPPSERTMLPWKLLDTEDYANAPAGEIVRRFTRSLAGLIASLESLDEAGWRTRIDLVSGRVLAVDVGSWVANHNVAHLAQLMAALDPASSHSPPQS